MLLVQLLEVLRGLRAQILVRQAAELLRIGYVVLLGELQAPPGTPHSHVLPLAVLVVLVLQLLELGGAGEVARCTTGTAQNLVL